MLGYHQILRGVSCQRFFSHSRFSSLDNSRKSHIAVFWFMMTYLLFFRTISWFGLPTPPGHTNMMQMILTLKLIGLAFERNSVITKARAADKSDDNEKNELTPVEVAIKDVGIEDMFHYCFNYIGLLTGKMSFINFNRKFSQTF